MSVYSHQHKYSKKSEAETQVLFRVARDGHEVTAIFPCLPGTNGNDMACFSHVGQHAVCSVSFYNATRAATPEEYAALKKELESPPYNYRLSICARITRQMHDERRAMASQ